VLWKLYRGLFKVKKFIEFAKNETVLLAAIILAAVSSFIITPDAQYIGYIDFRTLSILFCLMAVVVGIRKTGVFNIIAESLIKKVSGMKGITAILIMLCFFMSMFITNDVALIVFVPFTFTILNMLDKENKYIIPIVSMQTIAANLGSMLTPLGNPQNLYLFGKSNMSMAEFIMIMLPYSALSLILFVLWIIFRKNRKIDITLDNQTKIKDKHKLIVYSVLLIISMLTVSRVRICHEIVDNFIRE